MSALGISPKRSLGQHFLHDQAIVDRIVEAAGLPPDATVVEVGPGLGILTASLARGAIRVIAIEKDEALAASLGSLVPENVAIVRADALEIDPELLVDGDYHLVANLPYNIAAAVLRRFLDSRHRPRSCTVMVQREVAERIVACPPDMNILAVAMQFHGRPSIAFRVGRGAFTPPPRVESAVVRLDVRDPAPLEPEEFGPFFDLVRRGFGQRRKMLRNALSTDPGLSPALAAGIVEDAGIDNRARAQELDVGDWLRLHRALEHRSTNRAQ